MTSRAVTRGQRRGWVALAVATALYYIVQVIVAAAWSDPPYDWNLNLISDLGNTACGPFTQGGVTTLVCSPWHPIMNATFIVDGLLTAFGALALSRWWPRRRLAVPGTALLALGGAQRAMVGLFPENTVASLHTVGALNLITSAVAIVLLSITLAGRQRARALCGMGLIAVSALGAVALVLLVGGGSSPGLGPGGAERLIAYPVNMWPLVVLLLPPGGWAKASGSPARHHDTGTSR